MIRNFLRKLIIGDSPIIMFNKEKNVYEITLDKDLVINIPNNSVYMFSNNITFQSNNGVINLNPLPVFDSNDVELEYYHDLCIRYKENKKNHFLTDLKDAEIGKNEIINEVKKA